MELLYGRCAGLDVHKKSVSACIRSTEGNQTRKETATFQVMRRSFATWAKKAGVDAHTRSAQMGNTVDVNENEYAVATFDQKLAAIRRLEKAIKE